MDNAFKILTIAIFSIMFFGITSLSYGAVHPTVVNLSDPSIECENVCLYIVESVDTVPSGLFFASPNNQVEFIISVANTGNATLSNVIVTSTIKSGLIDFVGSSLLTEATGVTDLGENVCTIADNFVTCLVPNLAPREGFGSFSFFMTVDPTTTKTNYSHDSKVCAQDILDPTTIYCATDGSGFSIKPLSEPIPEPTPEPTPEPVPEPTPEPIPEPTLSVEERLTIMKMEIEDAKIEREEIKNRIGIVEQILQKIIAWINIFE